MLGDDHRATNPRICATPHDFPSFHSLGSQRRCALLCRRPLGPTPGRASAIAIARVKTGGSVKTMESAGRPLLLD